MTLKDIGDLGALGVILVSFLGGGLWLFRYYLPFLQVQFQKSLEVVTKNFVEALAQEREVHKSIQHASIESHDRQIQEIKLEIMDLTKELRLSNRQFSQFLTLWISTIQQSPGDVAKILEKI